MGKKDFRIMMVEFFKAPPEAGVLFDAVFDSFDVDNSNDIDFRELVQVR